MNVAQKPARGSSGTPGPAQDIGGLQGRDAPGSRAQCWALTQPRAFYREMLPSKVWAEEPTGVKDREAAVLLLLLRDTSDHMSQRKHGPGTPG